MPARVALAALGAGGHHQHVGGLAVEHDELLAIDHPARALPLGRGRDVLQVVARILLELGEGKGLAAVDDSRDVRGLLLGRTAMAQETAADHHGGKIGLQHQRLAERFHHDHGFDAAGAEPAIGFRKRQAEQALLGEPVPDRFAPAALLRHVFLALVEIVGIGQETVHAFLEQPLLLGQIKIHVVTSLYSKTTFVIPGCAARRRPGIHNRASGVWIPGSRYERAPE